MGLDLDHAAINEGVAFLERYSPATLRNIKESLTTLSAELEPGIQAGTETSEGILIEKAEFFIIQLDVALSRCSEAAECAGKKLSRAAFVRNVGQLCTVVSSSTVFGALELQATKIALISSIAALVSSLATWGGSFFEKVRAGGQSETLISVYNFLVSAAYDAKLLRKDLELSIKYSESQENLSSLVNRANELARKINEQAPKVIDAVLN